MEKEKEENIWRGKMSPWRDKQRTRKDLATHQMDDGKKGMGWIEMETDSLGGRRREKGGEIFFE